MTYRLIICSMILSGRLLAEPVVLDLWPTDNMPGPRAFIVGEERDLSKPDDRLIADRKIIKLGHVSTPQIHLYLPEKTKATGSAIVVAPGGGFSILAWDLEGTEVADWLNQIGVAAVVLKYRVPTRQHGDDGELAPKKALGPMMDLQRALSLTRANADEWGIDSERVGVMGFSAGGVTAALAAIMNGKRAYEPVDPRDQSSCRADFAMLIYPGFLADPETGKLKPFVKITEDSPPMFFAHAADDRVTCLSSTATFNALKLAGVPAALHIYESGGHGYGVRRTSEPVTQWPDRAAEWLEGR